MNRRTFSRLLGDYGMALVLLLLCIYYSYATLQPQQLSGDAAADAIVRKIPAGSSRIVIVAGPSPEDQQLARALVTRLPRSTLLDAEPPVVRVALQAMISGKIPPSAIIGTQDS